jgi:HD-GYP domain-containing protein (c-di-GMP phosphodiesterase class II)
MRREISIQELQPGMYVDEVTEQSGQLKIKSKGLVKSDKAIQLLLNKGVQKLIIDFSKSQLNDDSQSNSTEAKVEEPRSKTIKEKQVSFENEINKASDLYNEALEIQQNTLSDVKAGKAIDSTAIKQCAAGLVTSAFRNSDALACMTRLRTKNNYLMEHSVNCSVLMTLFAKHINLDQETIEQIATAALVADIGMIAVPDDILTKTSSLNEGDWEKIKAHVELGNKVLKKASTLADIGLQMIVEHHERIDGQGYPNKLTGNDISLYGKMFAIVDAYDSITADRPYRKAKSAMSAFKMLRAESGSHFDEKLVNEFINCIGIHPVGTLVKLESQKLGIIIKGNTSQPLKPKVNVFYSVRGKCHIDPKIIDLSQSGCTDSIEMSVRPEDFKIDMLKFFRQVLLS